MGDCGVHTIYKMLLYFRTHFYNRKKLNSILKNSNYWFLNFFSSYTEQSKCEINEENKKCMLEGG